MSVDSPPVRAHAHGRLLVCATPIGNLDDVTVRVLDSLRDADVLACEDTRHTRILLERHDIRAARLVSLHEHNERTRAPELAGLVADGATVALLSDAGTPLVSDPGFALVGACLQEELAVEVLPGPSAVLTALIASGLPVQRWRFVGFLPRRRGELERLLLHASETTLAFEAPRRLSATLALLAELDPDRPVAVCRELTKLHEEIRRGGAGELAAYYAEHAPRGEIVLGIGAASADATDAAGREAALEALHELVRAGAHPRRAAGTVARLTGLATNELYRELARGEQ